MGLEGLQTILRKDEVVGTQQTNDLLERPELVDEAYKRHVRTYIPIGRQSDGRDSHQSVIGFEKRVIREVRDGGALRGYITGEYGHGKTSAALYLWDRARSENLLAVPPFKLNKLSDLIVASFGWVRYEVGRTRPNLLDDAQDLYESLINRSADTLAQKYEINPSAAQQMAHDRPDILELTSADYIRFFEEMTKLAQQAGFEGLLIIADEVQQYIEPEIKSGIRDPISPLFDVIHNILTRRNYLNFGLILVIPPKELSLLRDQRKDLVHRALQVSLDLAAVYDQAFPERLWHRLAKEFEFEEHRDYILSKECLDSLGQISSREDLADGPRTVVDVFKVATRRYIELGYPKDEPYTPYHLIEDFVNGTVSYDSPKAIPRVVSQALSHGLVRGHTERERAVKWAAAFPNEGITRSLQERLGLTAAFDDLAQSALGDLIISVGDVQNRGMTLRGLDQVAVETDWLTTTIREFWRTYHETADITRQRTLQAFLALLTSKIFPSNQWTVLETISEGLTRNAGIVFEGSFRSFARRFPERKVHVRVLWEDEPIKDAGPLGEVLIQIRLMRHLDLSEEQRRNYTEPIQLDYETHRIDLALNLMYRDESMISPNLERVVGRIVSPYKLTPLLLFTMHSVIDEKREDDLIPKADDQNIQYMFQPDLLDNAFRAMFNEDVGSPFGTSQERILETALGKLLEAKYPNYDTFIRLSTWSNSLQKYRNALKHLETAHERQGQIAYEGTKDEVAALFTLTNTGLDSFISNFPAFIEITRDFPTRSQEKQGIKGAVRFTLHSLEMTICEWLRSSSETETVTVTGKSQLIHRILSNEIYHRAFTLGYRDKEIDVAIDIMEDRGLIEKDARRGVLREAITQAPSVDELASDIEAWQTDINTLLEAFSQSGQLGQWKEQADRASEVVENQLRVKPDDEKLIKLRRTVQLFRNQLVAFAEERHDFLRAEANRLLSRMPSPDSRQKQALENPVQGSVDYVQQVNDLRARVLRQYNATSSKMEQLQQSVQSSQASLKTEKLSLQSLVHLANAVQEHERQTKELSESRNEFTNRFNEFAAWTDLVESGSELLTEIQTLGEPVKEQREQLETLSQSIKGHLSANKLDALPDAPTYKMQLSEITEAVRRFRLEATSRFNDLQERYQRALSDGLDFPIDRLWRPLVYNPVDPEDSYMRLSNEVQTTLRNLCQRLEQTTNKEHQDILSTLRSPQMTALPVDERERLADQGDELDREFKHIDTQMNAITKQLEDITVIEDFPKGEEGRFHQLLQKIGTIRDTVVDLHPKVESLSGTLMALALTGPEDRLLNMLDDGVETVEVSELRQRAEKFSDTDFWSALRGLHEKRRFRVVVEKVRYD